MSVFVLGGLGPSSSSSLSNNTSAPGSARCKHGCTIYASVSWLEEHHYPDCPNRIGEQYLAKKQEDERLKKENAKIASRPIVSETTGTRVDQANSNARVAADRWGKIIANKDVAAAKRLLGSSGQGGGVIVWPPEKDTRGGEK